MSKTSTKVKTMLEMVFDLEKETEKREQAANNLVILARERAGSELLYKESVVPQIARLMKVEKNATIRLAMIRTIGGLCQKNEERSKDVLTACGIPFFLDILSSFNNTLAVKSKQGVIVNLLSKLFKHTVCMQCCEVMTYKTSYIFHGNQHRQKEGFSRGPNP